ncbi:hypothetical protein [Arcobacter lacus]|uniref:DUF2190 domain-containing protein n=1 Tax=Arcobacter lacus TaxID=1912876 RepID=A0ABX5JJA0_9BACT|nr:hypothetical protein [Arcobacter lacus]PUE66747.1 hypothetical protein B0175_05115 [Arcobacter lacus]
MAFASYDYAQIGNVDAGVINQTLPAKISTYTANYNAPLKTGKFSIIKTGNLANMDKSATPVVAGLVLQSVVNAIESGETFVKTGDGAVYQLDVLEWGLGTVDVKAGDTPTKFGKIYAVNSGSVDADLGKATTTATDNVEVKGYFNREIKAGVWEVFIQL